MKKIEMIKLAKEIMPDGQFKTGLFLDRVGRKYVYFYDILGGVNQHKMSIDEFWAEHGQKISSLV